MSDTRLTALQRQYLQDPTLANAAAVEVASQRGGAPLMAPVQEVRQGLLKALASTIMSKGIEPVLLRSVKDTTLQAELYGSTYVCAVGDEFVVRMSCRPVRGQPSVSWIKEFRYRVYEDRVEGGYDQEVTETIGGPVPEWINEPLLPIGEPHAASR